MACVSAMSTPPRQCTHTAFTVLKLHFLPPVTTQLTPDTSIKTLANLPIKGVLLDIKTII
jgi:hypothetical protein